MPTHGHLWLRTLDNKDLFDRGVQEQLGVDYMPVYKSWAKTLALLLEKGYWCNHIDVYYAIKEAGTKSMAKFLGPGHNNLTIHTAEPTITMIPMSKRSHPRNFDLVYGVVGPLKLDQPIQAPALTVPTIVNTVDRGEEAVLVLDHRVLCGIIIRGLRQ